MTQAHAGGKSLHPVANRRDVAGLSGDHAHLIGESNLLRRLDNSTLEPASIASIREKIRTLVVIANWHGSSISSSELLLLLPSGTFEGPTEVEEFVLRDTSLAGEFTVLNGEITRKGSEDFARLHAQQASLAERRLAQARTFADRLTSVCPWLRLVAVSGSTAMGRSRPSDDLDFFLVTARNRLWITVLAALLAGKIQRAREPDWPVSCFNRVLEEDEFSSSVASFQDPLVVRETLAMRLLSGSEYYRDRLRSASWMERVFPELYRHAIGGPEVVETLRNVRGGWPATVLNLIAFALLAPYFVAAGIWRNHRLRVSGQPRAEFRTIIRRGLFAYESKKYDVLREAYRRAF